LGGTIEPFTHRSVGVVLSTQDGGKNWQNMPCELPRITGTQLIGPNHLLAWGDWSNLFQSALFESTDGGQNWLSRPTPVSHIQCAASSANGTLVLVDRAGNVHRTTDGLDYQPVNLPRAPFDPIRFCKCTNGIWWLGGDTGQLYRSADAIQWERLYLPGNASDHALFSLNDLASFENKVWIVGQPGNVAWTSEDYGNTWSVRELPNQSLNHSISALNADVLLTCGPQASIRASRNGGKAWWTQHQSGGRNAVLEIAATSSEIGWDLLAHVTQESKRNAALLVVHDQDFEGKTSHLPELASRIEIAGKSIGLTQSRLLPNLPVGRLVSGERVTDLGYYQSSMGVDVASDSVALLRRLVLEIRTSRPDVVVSPCPVTCSNLESKTAQAIEQAMRSAGQRDFRVFSSGAGIPEDVWQTQRIILRGMKPGLQFSPAMILKSSSLVLGNVLAPIRPLIDQNVTTWIEPEKRYSYSILGAKSGTLREPLEGVLLDPSTQSIDRNKSKARLDSLMATSQWLDWRQSLISDIGNPLTPDRVWESKLRALAKSASPESVPPILLEIAIHCRQNGEWNRWNAAIEYLLEVDSQSSVAEAAFWEAMRHTGSPETQQVIAQQLNLVELRINSANPSAASSIQQTSPFAKNPNDKSPVQRVAFTNSVRRIPIATNRDLEEFARFLSKWPESFQSRRTEQSWGWLIAARYRSMQSRAEPGSTINLSRDPSVFWPPQTQYLTSWRHVGAAERSIPGRTGSTSESSASPNIASCPTIQQRPYLDGKGDEPFWNEAAQLELRDPWADDPTMRTTIRLARDAEFLYVLSRSVNPTETSTVPISTKPPMFSPKQDTPLSLSNRGKANASIKDSRRDSLSHSNDHIKMRIDIDRDYASWFEFGWSASGEISDACNDMAYWNPTWHIATLKESSGWSAEIAIPLVELIGSEPSGAQWLDKVWAFNATRHNPSFCTESLAPSLSDRMTPDSWLLIDLSNNSR
jgi:photosystem II stability/assembly factor-like uncharacterized protein